jgi:hypothetical protein
VLHEPSGRVHVLNAGAAGVWRRTVAAPSRIDTSSLVDDELGTLSGGGAGRSATAATVDQLVRAGLLAPRQTP